MANHIRPSVNVYKLNGETSGVMVKTPAVFGAPIRVDVLNFVHDQMRRNSQQAHSVSVKAGHQTSAESWGTGRAVARIPRVHGGGTSRSGQGAYGNMCRGGHMFAPIKVFRRWHRHINVQQRRYAMCAAIASTGVPALALARGHRIEKTPEFPLVIADDAEALKKTKAAKDVLKSIGAWSDIQKVYASERWRAGIGKLRNRRNIRKRGPIIIYNSDNGISRAFRNIPGITLINVSRLNLLKLAPGGHVGRFAVWTESAFKKLDDLYGSQTKESKEKSGFHLPRPIMSNTDVMAILNNPAIKSALKPRNMLAQRRASHVKKNPLKNSQVMIKLNPFAIQKKRKAVVAAKKLAAKRKAATKDKKETKKVSKPVVKASPKKAVKS
jgi:large subunit ribosomal protein L4e